MLQSPADNNAVEDWLNEDNDFSTSGHFINEPASSIPGTVCVNNVSSPEDGPLVHLNDIFAGNGRPSSLQGLFIEPKSEERFRGGGGTENNVVVTPKDLFKDNRNTLTKSRLSGIIATLDSQSQPYSSDQVFSWPIGTKNSAHNSITPSASTSKQPQLTVASNEEEYPHDIDFLEDSNDNPLSAESKIDDAINTGRVEQPSPQTPLQPHRHPKSTPISKSQPYFFPQNSYKDASESAIHQQSISNMQHPVSSLFAEDIKYSSIRSETSLLDLQQHFASAPAAEEQVDRNTYPSRHRDQLPPSAPKEILSKSTQQAYPLECFNQRDVVVEQLGILNLCKQSLTALPSLSKTLSRLNLSGNNLSNLKGLSGLCNLRDLRASDNAITSIDSILNMSSLQNLDLCNNSLVSLDFKNNNLDNLKHLNLEENEIQSIGHLDQLFSLQCLYLGVNKLESFHPKKSLHGLKVLELQDNLLDTFNGSQFPCLFSLKLDGNRITTLSKISHLNSISVTSQDSASVCVSDFQGQELDLSNNKKVSLSSKQLDNVQVLRLNSCSLSAIPKYISSTLHLKYLSLEHNNLSDISELLDLKELEVLHLVGNKLSDIVPATKILSTLPNLAILDVRDNLFLSSTYPSQIQREVAQIVLHSCFISSCMYLRMFNQEPISKSSRRKALDRMAALKSNASLRMKSSISSANRSESVFNEWVPKLEPLQMDMTVDEELVLEVLA